jgi:hypothetical protein
MSVAEKKHPTELIQIGFKKPRLYAGPKDKVKSLEKLIEEYLVENKNIPAHEVFKELDEQYSKVGNIYGKQ